MGQHFVPQQYLRAFQATGRPGTVWVFPRVGNSRLAGIKAVAQSSGFYDPDTEVELNALVEAPANPALQTLREGKQINPDDRHRVALYVATMLYRVPHNRKRGEPLAPAALAATVAELRQQLQTLEAESRVPPERIQAWVAELEKANQKFADRLPAEVERLVRRPWPSPEVTDIIRGMTWRVLVATPPEAFVTSDNPAFFFESFGLANPEAELILPLSPSHCLHCSHSRLGSALLFLTAGRELVREFNRRTATGATSILIAHARLGWPGKMLGGRKRPALNRVRWDENAA